MNYLALIPGVILGLGLYFIIAALLPRHPQLKAAIGRINESKGTQAPGSSQSMETRLGGWTSRHVPDSSWFREPTTDLRLIGMSKEKYYYDKILLATVGLLAPLVFGLFLQALGILPFYLPALIGIPIAILLWTGVDQDVKKKAKKARTEFTRAIAVYLELVAVERKRFIGPEQALLSAASVGQSWVFVRLRQELARAEYAGVTGWDALSTLSTEIDVPELDDVANIVRLSGEEGASIYETLRSRGKTLRHKLLAEENEKANSATERVQIPIAITLFVYVGIIMTPPVMGLFTN